MFFRANIIVMAELPWFFRHHKVREHIKLAKKSPRRGIEPRSGTRQAPILTIKLSRKKQSTHDGGRTHNLLIRSQTRCHYATRATVCWKLLYLKMRYVSMTILQPFIKHIWNNLITKRTTWDKTRPSLAELPKSINAWTISLDPRFRASTT